MGRIVVGFDGTFAGRSAVLWAARRAEALASPLLLVRVIDAPLGATLRERADARTALDAAARDARRYLPRLDVHPLVLEGDPSTVLAEAAGPDDLLVLGARGSSSSRDRAAASRGISLSVACAAAIAVVPEQTTRARDGVVAGIDDSPAGWAAVRFAAVEAARSGQELTLVLATPTAPASARRLEREAALTARALRAATDAAGDSPLTVRARTVRRPPAAALRDLAVHAGLLVVGVESARGPASASLGATARGVLVDLATPTILARPLMAIAPA